MFDTIPDMAFKRPELSLDALAFHENSTERDWSFARINATADGVAAGLRAAGFVAGDRLAIVCQNRGEFFITLFPSQKAGVILCPLNWRQPAVELSAALEPVSAKALIWDTEFAATAIEVATQPGLAQFTIENELSIWIANGGPALRASIDATRPWYLLFTSGTTGRPKTVIQTTRIAWMNSVNIVKAVQMSSADRSLYFLPLFHTAGINLHTLPVFLNGGNLWESSPYSDRSRFPPYGCRKGLQTTTT